MLRPRESRDLRVLSHDLKLATHGDVTWAQDVFGNTVAMANFAVMTDRLAIESFCQVKLDSEAWPVFPIARSAISYPFRYSDDEWTDLGSLRFTQYDEPGAGWITFDPTNRSVGGGNLSPVAVARDIRQVIPVSGHGMAHSAPECQLRCGFTLRRIRTPRTCRPGASAWHLGGG